MRKLLYWPVILLLVILTACTSQRVLAPLAGIDKTTAMNTMDTFQKAEWYPNTYAAYQPKPEAVDALNDSRKKISIIAIGGTWCTDTQDLLPKFYKTVDAANIPRDHIRLIGVNEEKTSPDGSAEKFSIERVPTFIIYVNGEEKGRIAESVRNSIEEDMVKIVQGE